MLIVAGHLVVHPTEREAYVAAQVAFAEAALAAPGCLDFAITADALDPGRIRIYERWTDEASLLAFRGSGPSVDQLAVIVEADVRRFTIAAAGEA